MSVRVKLQNGHSRRCHFDQIRFRTVETPRLTEVDHATPEAQNSPAEIVTTTSDDQVETPEVSKEPPEHSSDESPQEPARTNGPRK